MPRERLPNRRVNRSVDLIWQGHIFTLTVGFFDKTLKRLGEIFADSGKTPENVQQVVQDTCVIISISLQYGVPLSALVKSILRHDNGQPYTVIGALCDVLERTDWTEIPDGVETSDPVE